MNRQHEMAKALNAHAEAQRSARLAKRTARALVRFSAFAVALSAFSAFAVVINLSNSAQLIGASFALGIAVTLSAFAIRETVSTYAKAKALNAQAFAHQVRALGHASVITGEIINL